MIGLDADVLARLATMEALAADVPDLFDMGEGRKLADTFRMAMPEVDDTTLALRLLALSDAWEADYLARSGVDLGLYLSFVDLRAAVLDLTSITRGESI